MKTIYSVNDLGEPAKFVICDELLKRMEEIKKKINKIYVEPGETIRFQTHFVRNSLNEKDSGFAKDEVGDVYVCRNNKKTYGYMQIYGFSRIKHIGNDLFKINDIHFTKDYLKDAKEDTSLREIIDEDHRPLLDIELKKEVKETA